MRYGPFVRPRSLRRPAKQRPTSKPPGLRRSRLPISVVLSGGKANDCTRFKQVMGSISALGSGRSVPPDHMIGNKGYSSRKIRSGMCIRDIAHTIPEHTNQTLGQLNRGPRGSRPPRLDRGCLRPPQWRRTLLQPPQQWAG